MIIQLKNVHMGKGRTAGRVGSGQTFCRQSRVGSGRVNVSPGRVGSGLRKVTRGQLWPIHDFLSNFHWHFLSISNRLRDIRF